MISMRNRILTLMSLLVAYVFLNVEARESIKCTCPIYEYNTNSQMKKIMRGEQPIYYYMCGDTHKELIIMLHSAFGDHQCFNNQIKQFSKSYCVITIDILGHGQSKIKKINEKIDASIYHIADIMNKEGFEKAHIIGVSMGALIAEYFAQNFPHKVNSLSLTGAYDINTSDKHFIESQGRNSIKLILKVLFSMDSFRRDMAKAAASEKIEQEHFYTSACHFERKAFIPLDGIKTISQPRNGIVYNFPLQILCGDKDIDLAKEAAAQMHEKYLGSEYIIVENAGHCANMDNPQKYNESVLNFISKHTNNSIFP